MAEEFDEDRFADEGGEDNDAGEEQDEFETMLDVRPKDVWSSAGPKKNEIVRELIKCFGSMVESHAKEFAVQDHKGRFKTEDLIYEKLLDAPKYVAKAKRALIMNENFDTRNFSLFIANKKWMKNILRPLLELCAKDDSILAMRCCSLALVLIRRLSDASQKVLADATRGAKRKASSADLQANEDDKEEDEKGNAVVKDEASERGAMLARIENVKQQVSALLSFKEALCSDKCNEAIANAFKEFWLKEQVESSEDNKTGVAICFSYLRRILAIEAHAQWSSPGEVMQHRSIHDKYIVQLRLLLSVIPGVCSDLLRGYHNDWLGDVILIIYFTLRGFEPKELHRVWQTGALIEDFENLDSYEADELEDAQGNPPAALATASTAALAASAAKKVIDVIVPTSLAQANRQNSALGKGKLSQMLQKERNNFAAVKASATAASRLRGVYQRTVVQTQALPALSTTAAAPPAVDTALDRILGGNPLARTGTAAANTGANAAAAMAAAEKSAEDGPAVCHMQTSKILRNPFAQAGSAIPQVQAKRNKKNLTFALDATLSETSNGQHLTSDEHQKAAVVAATLANLLSNELSLKPLVKRVNEDLRRDDMRIGQDLELRYFDILYRVLHYNRLKVADEYRRHQNATAAGTGVERAWEPNLKNVMDALDRMSFTRVVTAIERVGKNAARTEDVVIPLSLYKEMVCYLRVLLESGLEGHHEIAIAALHRLFYASAERLDPLPKLLSAWKSGTYPRRHLNVLVELVHETLKTLEAAQLRFRPEGDKNAEDWARKKYKRKGGKNEMDLEQYVMACMRFIPDEYFKRIVTNQTVRMYTKLLSHYAQNEAATNYFAYCFLRRMNAFTLEQDVKTPSALKSTTAHPAGDTAEEEVSLGFMLFNIQTLDVFSKIINDRDVYENKAMEPLLRLIKSIVRRFGQAAAKNHMMFVELLFQHPRPHEFCCTLDSVYEAPAHAAYVNATSSHNKRRDGQPSGAGDEDGSGSDSASDSSSDEDFGDEFDENNVSEAFKATVSEKQKARLAKQPAKEDRKRDKASRQARKEEKRAKSSAKATAKPAESTAPRASRFAWMAEEDEILKTQYALYAGTRSVFTNIAQNPELKALGMHRSEAQVAKRVKELNLHMQISYSDDEEEEEEDDDEVSDQDEVERDAAAGSQDSDGELEIAPPAGARSSAAVATKPVSSFRGAIFSDDEDAADDALGLDGDDPFSPLPPAASVRGNNGQRGQTQTQGSTLVETQLDTQYDTQMTAFSPSSPAARAPTGRAHAGGSGTQDSDFAGLFSPSDTSLNDDIEQEGRQARSPTATAPTQPERDALNVENDSSAPSTAKKTRRQKKGPKWVKTPHTASGRAAWDIDEGEPDIFEQRAMALMKATGGVHPASSEDDEPAPAGKNKQTKRAAATAEGRKGLVKRPKTASRNSETRWDDEDDMFGGSGKDEMEVDAPTQQTEQQRAAQKAALNKKRSMRIESDDEE